jgi:3-isopropylmalate/(R)-2-methylmalate dehydratase large subunit
MEFTGEVIERLPISDRLTMCNMAIEAGGKNGIIAPDKLTLSYLKEIGGKAGKIYQSDPEAVYEQVVEIDCGKIEPQVAFPPLPGNSRPISEVGEVFISQVVIGSCTNGRLEDLRLAAQILKGKKIHPEVRMIILPGTQQIYLQALREGLIEVFILAGAVVSTPTCGPCLGGHMGILAPGEVAIATTNRNFVGRMGHPKSKVYLSNPAVAAASALAGKIIGPEEK